MQGDPFIQNGVFVIEDIAESGQRMSRRQLDRLRRHEDRVVHARTALGRRRMAVENCAGEA